MVLSSICRAETLRNSFLHDLGFMFPMFIEGVTHVVYVSQFTVYTVCSPGTFVRLYSSKDRPLFGTACQDRDQSVGESTSCKPTGLIGLGPLGSRNCP